MESGAGGQKGSNVSDDPRFWRMRTSDVESGSGGQKGVVPHINEAVPSFGVPPYRRQRYEDMVPDTLDIGERCALAVNGLTGTTDPEREYLVYFKVNFNSNPPSMTHNLSDMCQAKFMEALPLMRLASGSDLNSQVDPVWMATALRMIGPDGLVYWPSFPWAKTPPFAGPCPEASHYAMTLVAGRIISAMTVYMLRDPEGPWRQQIERVVPALNELAIHQDDFAYFPQGAFVPGGPRPRRAEIPRGIWSSLAGWTTQGLAHFGRVAGYEPALELAGRLSRYVAYHGQYYGQQGEFLPDHAGFAQSPAPPGVYPFDPGPLPPPPDKNTAHFQHHMVPLLGMLDYALAAGDREIADFVRRSFEWARTKEGGDGMVGYFPEDVDNTEFEPSETCEVAGMIGLALKLSHAGLGDYWDDADRWVRNQFAESQLRRADWVYQMHMGGLVFPYRPVPLSRVVEGVETTDRVPERSIGAFAGSAGANDFFEGQGAGIVACCTGNGARGLYFVWEHMLTSSGGQVQVNLLMNRASPWADVHSHIPYAGQVDVHVKQPCLLKVRIPEWVTPQEVACRVNDDERRLQWEGRYAIVGPVSVGAVATLSFPIAERTDAVNIEKQRYILTRKGNDVVSIYPRGRFSPFYQRDDYRDGATRWRKLERVVSEEEAIYW